jgi:hypothetical protein
MSGVVGSLAVILIFRHTAGIMHQVQYCMVSVFLSVTIRIYLLRLY